jgi:NADH:ubiquinone oxidoreductase subunit 4 (subunit M)
MVLDKFSMLLILLTVFIIMCCLNFIKSPSLNITLGRLLNILILSFRVSKFFRFYVFFELSIIPMLIIILG